MNKILHRVQRGISVAFVGCSLAALQGCGGGSAGGTPPSAAVNKAGLTEQVIDSLVPEVQQPAAVTVDPVAEDRKSPKRTQQRLGANLTNVRSYSRTHEFVDLVKGSDGFGNPNTFGSSDAVLGPDGWPTADFSITLLTGQKKTKGLGGTYLIAYRGNATVDNASCASPGTIQNKRTVTLPDKQNPKLSVQWNLADLVFPEGGSQLCLIFKHAKGADGKPLALVKDLQVIRPAYYSDWPNPPTFTKQFLDHLAHYSTLRFMDWLDTNAMLGSAYTGPEGVWANRPTAITKRTASGSNVPRGMPWEYVVELANTRATDIWINVPPKADEAYAVELAKFLKANLRYDQRIYVEYGNEMWNGMFQQTQNLWVQGMDEASKSTDLARRLNYDGMLDKLDSQGNKRPLTAYQYDLGARLYTDRLVRISEAFRSVFGDDAMMTRVRPVLAWQLTNPGSTLQLLDYVVGAWKQPPARYFYAFAGAPYYAMTAPGLQASKDAYAGKLAPGWTSTTEPTLELDPLDATSLSLNAVVSSLRIAVDNSAQWGWYEANSAMARKYQLHWLAYEGGPDTMGIESAKNKAQANRDERMYGMCRDELDMWYRGGGELFMWFTAGAGDWEGAYGSWPLVENMTDPAGPKLRCMDWTSANPAPAQVSRHPMPGEVLATRVVQYGGVVNSQFADVSIARTWYAAGQSQDYAVSSAQAACYQFNLNLSNTSFSRTYNTVPFEVWVNGAQQLSPAAATLPPNSPVTKVPMGKVCLPAGISVVTLKLTMPTSITLTSFEMQ